MPKRNWIGFGGGIVLAILAGYFLLFVDLPLREIPVGNPISIQRTVFIRLPNAFILRAEVAATPEEQTIGLGHRPSLPEDRGMLFVSETEEKIVPHFWMRDMLFDLDFIWIDGRMIVDITPNVPKESFLTFQTFTPRVPVTAVLEVNAGFAKRQGLKIGNVIEINTGPRPR